MKKNILLLIAFFLFVFSCQQTTNESTDAEIAEPVDPMEGVWENTTTYWIANGDTIGTGEDIVQHKIYLDGFFIWNTNPTPDSSEWHGYGTYTYNDGIVTEKLLSMSYPMHSAFKIGEEAILKVEFGENTYFQIIENTVNDTTYQNIEHYRKLN